MSGAVVCQVVSVWVVGEDRLKVISKRNIHWIKNVVSAVEAAGGFPKKGVVDFPAGCFSVHFFYPYNVDMLLNMLIGQSWNLGKMADCLLAGLNTLCSRTGCLSAYFFNLVTVAMLINTLVGWSWILGRRADYLMAGLGILSSRTGCLSAKFSTYLLLIC